MTTPWTCLLVAVGPPERIRALADTLRRSDSPIADYPYHHAPQVDTLAKDVDRLVVRGLRIPDTDTVRALTRQLSETPPTAVRITGHRAFQELFGAAARAGGDDTSEGPNRVPEAVRQTPWSGTRSWPALMEAVEAQVSGPLRAELTDAGAPVTLV